MIDIEKVIELLINGMFTGIAVTVGTYLANKGLIKHIEKLVKRLKNERY